ncbi:acyltransferase family protein [Motilimonas pumila]|uniref:Acyltransferase n=1 Tax=Motilimonas pumila TaxID=2303987 RepID=A0A418YCB5_9GAMM|nr:acyltransferase [Motilimonas pumila]RJG42099.1 acyltransferase [Motilimonas pumila]
MKATPLKPRDFSVDTLRGLACILLILCHVVGVNALNGLKIEEGFWRQATDFLAYMRMPLFTFLSGYIYASRPFNGHWQRFIGGKMTRLLVPMLVVGTTYAITHSISSNVDYNWLYLHICPVNLYWFVESLFLIFMALIVMEALKLLDKPAGFTVCFLIFSALYAIDFEFSSNFFSINGAIYLMPFFLAGLACYRFKLELPKASFIVLALTSAYALMGILDLVSKVDNRSVIGLLIGTLSCYGLLKLQWHNRFLSYIGHYSYSIYLFHIFFIVFARKVLEKMPIDNLAMAIIIGSVLGILGPILVEKLVSKNRFSHLLCLGVWKKRHVKEYLTHPAKA